MFINFEKDEVLIERVKKGRCFGLESSRNSKEVLGLRQGCEDYFIDCLRIYNTAYVCFYTSS